MSVVRVRRSGGFLGRTTTGECDLSADDPVAAEVRDLVAGVDFAAPRDPRPRGADRYVYEFELDDRRMKVHEHDLTEDLRRIVAMLLG